MDYSNLDLNQLAIEAIARHDITSKLEVSALSEYITIERSITSTPEGEQPKTVSVELSNLGADLDINKVRYLAETVEEVSFIDKDNQVFSYPAKTFGKNWIIVDQKGILGSLLTKAYDDLIKSIQNQVPHHLRDKVK